MTDTCKLVITNLDNELTKDQLEETEEGIKIKQLDHYCEDPILFFPLIRKENAYILKTSTYDYKTISHTYTVYHIQVLYNWISKHGTDPFTRIAINDPDIETAYQTYKQNYFKKGTIYTIESETDADITLKGKKQEMGLQVKKLPYTTSDSITCIFDNTYQLIFKRNSNGLTLVKKRHLKDIETLHFHVSLGHKNNDAIIFFQTKQKEPYANYYGLQYEPDKQKLFNSILKDKNTYLIRVVKEPFEIELYKARDNFNTISVMMNDMPFEKIDTIQLSYMYNKQEKTLEELEPLIGQTYTNVLEKRMVIELNSLEENIYVLNFIKLYFITSDERYNDLKFINGIDAFEVEEETEDLLRGKKVDLPDVIYVFKKYHSLPNTYVLLKKES